jgi:hypothetical protein
LGFGNKMICQSIVRLIGNYNTLNKDFFGDMNKEVSSVEESKIVLEGYTSVNHFEEQLELNGIHKCFVEEDTQLFVKNFDLVSLN